MNNKPPSDNIPSELASTNSNNNGSTLSSLQDNTVFRSSSSSASSHVAAAESEDEKLAMPPAFRQFLSFSQPAVLEEEVVYRSLMPQIADGPTGLYNPNSSKGDLDLQPPTLMAFKSAPLVNNPWQVNGKSAAPLQGGVMKARSDVSEQLSQVSSAPVPELPTYFEKYTSFHSLCFPQKIFEQLVEALKTLAVDFELLGARQQIQGCFYEEHNSAKFQINLFKTGRKYLVEVQRRSGDSMAFNALYQRLKKELLASPQSIIEQSQAQPAPQVAPARPPAYDVVLDQASLQPLKTMAESQYVDVAREGMKMLARCSTSVDNHLLLSSQCLDLFRSRLSSPDEELARYAAFILANLSKTSAVSEHLSATSQILEALFVVLQRTDSKEIRRQLAQSVHNVSLSRPNCFSKDQLDILRPLRASPDTRLSQLIDNTLARFQVGQV